MSEKLFLYLRELHKSAPWLAKIWKIGPKEQKAIEDLDDMAKEITQHKTLDELVIFTHGYMGGISLGEHAYNLGEAKVAEAFAKTKTQIEHIRFEGCWVGEGPADMAAFGRLFNALDVSGFTWTHWSVDDAIFTLPKGTTLKQLQDLQSKGATSPIAPWLAPPPATPSLAQLVSMAQQREITLTLPLEWFQYTLDMKPPYLNNNFQRLGEKLTYKVRADATNHTVQAKEAKGNTKPIPPFEYVTVVVREAEKKPAPRTK